MERSLKNDKLHQIKLGVNFNKAFDHDLISNNLTARVSSELMTNH